MKHITIAIPVRRWTGPESLSDEFRAGFKQLVRLAPGGYKFDVAISVRDLCNARNQMVSDALNGGKDGVFFMDDDMPWDAANVLSIIERDLPVCGGLYCKKVDPPEWVCSWRLGNDPIVNGAVRVLTLGAGFKYYRRDVFEAIAKKVPENLYADAPTKQTHYGFFQQKVVANRFWTEDYHADLLCEYCGIPVWADTRVKLRHFNVDDGKFYPLGDKWPEIPVLKVIA